MAEEKIYVTPENQGKEPIAAQVAGILIGHLTLLAFVILLILMAYIIIMPLSSILSPTGDSFDNAIFYVLVGCAALFRTKSVILSFNK